jgi:multiple sugar transport system permease protein
MIRSKLRFKEAIEGYLCISPFIIGFLLFAAGPVIASLILSFYKWDIISAPQFVGFKNYAKMMNDPMIALSLQKTLYFAILSIPTGMIGALFLALLLNQKLRGMRFYRTAFYVPSITSGVATLLLWSWLFHPNLGAINKFLYMIQLPWISEGTFKMVHLIPNPPLWFGDPNWAMPALIIMNLWGVGGGMIIYLAGLQGIPEQLYEASLLDGASNWQKFRHVTLPMLSPTIFFNLIMSIIGSFQVFNAAFIMTRGGPSNATMFYALYLFNNAFIFFRMGYASAMAWLLFIIILIITLIQFKAAPKWVYYEGGR